MEFDVSCVSDPVEPFSNSAKRFVGNKVATGRIVMQLAYDLFSVATRQYQLVHMVIDRA